MLGLIAAVLPTVSRAQSGYPTSIMPTIDYKGTYVYADLWDHNLYKIGPYVIEDYRYLFHETQAPDGSAVLTCTTDFLEAESDYDGGAWATLISYDDKPPKMQLFVEASAPPMITEDGQPLNEMQSRAKIEFEDELGSQSPGMTAAGMKLRFHADALSEGTNPSMAWQNAAVDLVFDVRYGDQHVHKIFSRSGTYHDDGTAVFDSYEPVAEWNHSADFDLTLPKAPLFGGINLSVTIEAVVSALNDAADGPTHAKIDASHTVEILGLIPYDAAGNVLPANAASFTSAAGFTYPVLTAVPEPGTLALVGFATAWVFQPRGRLRSRGSNSRPSGV